MLQIKMALSYFTGSNTINNIHTWRSAETGLKQKIQKQKTRSIITPVFLVICFELQYLYLFNVFTTPILFEQNTKIDCNTNDCQRNTDRNMKKNNISMMSYCHSFLEKNMSLWAESCYTRFSSWSDATGN